MSLTYAFFDDLNAFSSTFFLLFGLDERGRGGEVARELSMGSDRETFLSLPRSRFGVLCRFLFSNVASRRCSDACETCGKSVASFGKRDGAKCEMVGTRRSVLSSLSFVPPAFPLSTFGAEIVISALISKDPERPSLVSRLRTR